jgi:hypothetical protein
MRWRKIIKSTLLWGHSSLQIDTFFQWYCHSREQYCIQGIWDSSVSILIGLQVGWPGRGQGIFLFTIAQWYSTGLQAGWSWVWVLVGTRNFSLHHRIQASSGTKADHLPPSSAKVKNVWSYTSTPTTCLHGMVLSLTKSTGTTLPVPFTTVSRPALGPTQPPIQWVPRLTPGVKQLVCETDHLPPSNVKVKNAWSYTSTPPYIFIAWCLVKYRMSSWHGT